jgi:hypothetical protein
MLTQYGENRHTVEVNESWNEQTQAVHMCQQAVHAMNLMVVIVMIIMSGFNVLCSCE